jgi:hypothetical protein
MRYILDDRGYVKYCSNTYITCENKTCTSYEGVLPEGYKTLEEWVQNANIRAYKIVSGNLVYDSAEDARLQQEYANNSIMLNFNDNYVYTTDRDYHCFRMGQNVFLNIRTMGFIQKIGHGEVLISGLPKPTRDIVFYLYGGLSAKGETVRCMLNMEGNLQSHYTHPPSIGNSADYQFGGFVVYETKK